MTAIIDADSIIWTIAYNARDRAEGTSLDSEVDSFIEGILLATDCDSYIGFLGSGKTFRHELFEDYKAKRPPKPEWFIKHEAVIVSRMVEYWKFNLISGIEADDAVSICHNLLNNTVLCGCDKDFMQCSGTYFDFGKNELYEITKDAANYNLWHQVLTGDSTDNIPGLRGVGPVKAEKILAKGTDFRELTRQAFMDKHGEVEGIVLFYFNYELVKLLDQPEHGFKIPEIIKYNTLRNEEINESTSI